MISLDGKNLPQHVDCDTSKLEVQRKRRKEIEINGQKAGTEFGKLRRQEISKIGRNNKEVKEGRKEERKKVRKKEGKKKRKKERKKERK